MILVNGPGGQYFRSFITYNTIALALAGKMMLLAVLSRQSAENLYQ